MSLLLSICVLLTSVVPVGVADARPMERFGAVPGRLPSGWTITATATTLSFVDPAGTVRGTLNTSGEFASATGTFSTAVNAAAARNAAGTGPLPLTEGAIVSASKGTTYLGGTAPTAPTTGVMIHGGTLANQDIEVLGKTGSAFGLCSPRLAVGAAGSALPTDTGSIRFNTDMDQRAGVICLDFQGLTGTAAASDYLLYRSSSVTLNNNGTSSVFVSPFVRGTSNFDAGTGLAAKFGSGISFPGSAAPTAPTTGITVWGDLTSGSPTLALLGASGKTPNISVPGTVSAKRLVMADAGALTCATDAVTVTGSYHTIIGEGGLADDLVTINGGVDGAELAIQADDDAVTITVKSTGNIVLGSDVALATSSDYLLLKYSGALSKWVKVSAVTY